MLHYNTNTRTEQNTDPLPPHISTQNLASTQRRVGNYRLLRSLGRGEQSEIFLGEHEYFHTQVAIKLLDARREKHDVDTFLAQASVLVHLQHPHIVQVLDFGMEGNNAYLIMDFAPYGSLRQRHPKGVPLPLETITTYVTPIAEALHYIHQHHLVHRDIKPHNMLIGAHNEILLGDFGIALVSESSAALDMHTYDFEGTVLYAAPEQLQGKPRRSSDQYALAVVTYEWLTGTLPFSGSFDEVVYHHLFTPPPPLATHNCIVSPLLEHVLMKALSKEPEQRFPHVRDFAEALEQAVSHTLQAHPEWRPSQPPRRQFVSPLPFPQLR